MAKIKKGDNVIVISGKDKGKTGKVSAVVPAKSLVVLAGVNLVKKHSRSRKGGQKGQIIEKPMPIHISNVMAVEGSKRARIGYKTVGDKKVRISRQSGKEI